MAPPRSVKETQRLTGIIAALKRFMSKSADRCFPFFHTIKKMKDFQWTEETLYLYLSEGDEVVSSILCTFSRPRGQPLEDEPKEVHLAEEAHPTWRLFVDGSYNAKGSRAGLILTPDDAVIEYALRFDFPASNNEAEYEALLVRLQLARDLGSKHIEVFSDSQLVVNHVNGEYEAREQSIAKYLAKV
ncbi:PREDICTED: uncharacterized protein LOC104586028 [Nelumbo nucifera]|uniref:Uncharacterized protein LOC104586028 n=1 Tax=Nelumbo nucifera TaxID=4432 RepID=A0A1U7Z3U6_NELNU|nr:PREDICTED: uncharacterized protein LOC104586028 [Nelumbo nucifera]